MTLLKPTRGGAPSTVTPPKLIFAKSSPMLLHRLLKFFAKFLRNRSWNLVVFTCNALGDVFLNEELVGKSSFIIPYITVERLLSGESSNGTGLNGNICNVIFSKTPMTTEQIRWNYNTLKTVEPPLIGTKTIADEVNNVGKTDIYTK